MRFVKVNLVLQDPDVMEWNSPSGKRFVWPCGFCEDGILNGDEVRHRPCPPPPSSILLLLLLLQRRTRRHSHSDGNALSHPVRRPTLTAAGRASRARCRRSRSRSHGTRRSTTRTAAPPTRTSCSSRRTARPATADALTLSLSHSVGCSKCEAPLDWPHRHGHRHGRSAACRIHTAPHGS